MQLSTTIKLKPQQSQINYDSKVVLLGSCFAENIGKQFDYFQFRNLCNPFGVLFHSKAIETLLWMAVQREQYSEGDLFFHNESWHCFDAHSVMSDPDKNRVISGLNEGVSLLHQWLKSASHVIITLGTSWVYKLRDLDMVVANCHKVPQKEFDKMLLSPAEIMQNLRNCIQMIKEIAPDVSILFTVSPVRHLKDGMIENNRSKAHLLAAVHQIVDKVPSVFYFPSYEIMMDELRDYRYYNEDMIHPSPVAIQYIWNKFSEVWISENANDTMKNVAEIQKGQEHRPFNPQSEKHQAFLQKLQQKKEIMQRQFPFMSF